MCGTLGRDNSIQFWIDVWISSNYLGDQFPFIVKLPQTSLSTWKIVTRMLTLALVGGYNGTDILDSRMKETNGKHAKPCLQVLMWTMRWIDGFGSMTKIKCSRVNHSMMLLIKSHSFFMMVYMKITIGFPSKLTFFIHFFAFCSFARTAWCHIAYWALVKLHVIPSSSLDSLLDTSNYGLHVGLKKQKAVETVLKSQLWCIWKARDDHIFNSKNACPLKTMEEIWSII